MSQERATIEGGIVAELRALQTASRDHRLSRGDIGVYSVLLSHARDGLAYPGPARISEMARLAVSNVKQSLGRLEDLKYIETIRTKARVRNRYRMLEPPMVPSLKGERARAAAARELGMRAGPAAKPSKAGAIATKRAELGMRAGPAIPGAPPATGDACRPPTGHACRPELGMRAGPELAFNSPSELKERRTKDGEMPKAAAECFAMALGRTATGGSQ